MSDNGMVERVAKAIFDADRAGKGMAWEQSALVLDRATRQARAFYLRGARAAIAAMREATDHMVDRGLYDSQGFNLLGVNHNSLAAAYERMIDAALKEEPKP